MLYEAGSDVNAPSWDGYTSVMEAVSWSNHDAMELLLLWGANPDLQSNLGQSALHKALEVGDEGVVEILLEA